MKTLLVFVSIVAFASPSSVPAQQQSVALENIIYLLQKECGEPQLTFVEDKYWVWSYSVECPKFEPVEIKPGERYQLPSPIMRIEIDEDKFREDKGGPPGKYIIAISYSFNPSYVAGKPEMGYSLSQKFSIIR
ncbi:MAG: hypothetical protein LC754_06385 [Acidobacteria bacterium]|nr:hypothetical protein [Acidobacteriota bacterium]